MGRGFVGFFFFRFGANVFASLRRRVRRTLYDLYCPYFSPEAMVKLPKSARGHFVTLTQKFACISGPISDSQDAFVLIQMSQQLIFHRHLVIFS